MTEEELDLYFETLRKLGLCLRREWYGIKHKPILGGAFSARRYCLASNFYSDTGLYEVHYYVVDVESGFPLSFGETKDLALSKARKLLQKYQQRVWAVFGEMSRDVREHDEKLRQQNEERIAQMRANRPETVKSVPKRRKQIFDASEGKCHYCETALTLDGKWHIEHKMPKALMGGNEPTNLVASCVTCNHRKKDKTDVEFKAQLVRESFSPSPAKESEKV